MEGLYLSKFYNSSDECTSSIVYIVDEWIYFENNYTYPSNWFDPVLNFTGFLNGHLSSSIPECYYFGKDVYYVTGGNLNGFSSVGSYILAFVFNLLGGIRTVKDIFEGIDEAYENQNYTHIPYQYGRAVRTLFDFEPLSLEAYTAIIQ